MRVLHIGSGNLFGGVEVLLLTLVRQARYAPGMQSRIALCFEGALSGALEEAGSSPLRLGPARIRWPWTVQSARRRLAANLDGIDRVVCHGSWAQALFGPVARAAGIPLVFWLHHAPGGRHWLERWTRRIPPDLVICNSRYTASALPALYPEVRAEVFYAPVPLPEGAPVSDRPILRDQLRTPREAPVILQASRLEPWKGQVLHLEALARIKDLSWIAWFAGGGQRPAETRYLRSLEREARCLGVSDRVRFLGQRSDVPALMAASDLYCQPNTGPEPFGIVLVEALQARLPVVSTALGGAMEIVDTSCGMLTSPGDVPALAGVLRSLLGDSVLRTRLASAGPGRARALCDPAVQMPRLHTILERV